MHHTVDEKLLFSSGGAANERMVFALLYDLFGNQLILGRLSSYAID